MALVTCPDCRTAVSDRAPACPKCGAPNSAATVAAPTPKPKRKTHPVTWAVAIGLIAFLGYATWKQDHEAKLPDLPVNVKFRPALLGPGYVLHLENTSGQPLQLMASLTHPAINDTRRFDVYIPPRSFTEVSKFNGWITQSGDRITLENSNYKSWNGSIP